jgi:hypothetical protein
VTLLSTRILFLLLALALPMLLSPILPAQETARLSQPFWLPDAPLPQPDPAVLQNISHLENSSLKPKPPAEMQQKPMTDAQKRKTSEDQLQQELHQRMAGVIPNFNAVLGGTVLPLSPRQKMRAAFHSAVDPYQFGLAFITSSYGQATDSHSTIDPDGFRHGYGQGLAGFGKRYGASYADQFTGAVLGNGFFPAILHQDSRYYRMGTGSFAKRFFYSLSTTMVCRGDNGKRQPNYSNLLGNLASGSISNLYYPQADRGFGLTIKQGFIVTAEGSFGGLLIEFYPDIRKHIRKRHNVAPAHS